MALIDKFVDITISRATKGLTRAEFATILIIGDSTDNPAVKEYHSMSEVLVDYDTATTEYAMANAVFRQDVTVDKILITQTGAAETYLQAYNRVSENYNFYAVIVGAKNDVDLMPLANAIEASKSEGHTARILGAVEQDLADLNLMTNTHAASLDRTFVIYNSPTPLGVQTFADAAWLGAMLPKDPGTATWAFKTLVGIVPDTPQFGGLNSQKIAAIEALNGNYYTTVGGRNITFGGTMASGEYIDIIYGIDWLENTMQQDVFNVYTTLDKIPYTAGGIDLIEIAMRQSLDVAVARGFVDSYKITTPDITTIPFNDKATRTLQGVTFEAKLTGAIHKTIIKGFVTL